MQIINISGTASAYYNELINSVSLQQLRNSSCKILMMSPIEYFTCCMDNKLYPVQEDITIEKLIDMYSVHNNPHTAKLLENMKPNDKFPLPLINQVKPEQDGFHRMSIVGELLGYNEKVPVLIVEPIDFELARKERTEEVHKLLESWLARYCDARMLFGITGKSLDDYINYVIELFWKFNRKYEKYVTIHLKSFDGKVLIISINDTVLEYTLPIKQ